MDVRKVAPVASLPVQKEAREAMTFSGIQRAWPEVAPERLQDAVERLNPFLEGSRVRLHYAVHEATNRVIVSVIDRETGEIVKQIPPEKLLDLVARIMEFAGLLMDSKA